MSGTVVKFSEILKSEADEGVSLSTSLLHVSRRTRRTV